MTNVQQRAVRTYLEQLERELKRAPGIVPEEGLADAREFLQNELKPLLGDGRRLDEQEILQHFCQTFGEPKQVAAGYAETVSPSRKLPGYAPGWRVCCTKCGRSAPADRLGMIRIKAWSYHKYILAYCRDCRALRWARVIKDLEQSNLTQLLWDQATPAELRQRMHGPPASLLIAMCFAAAAIIIPLIVLNAVGQSAGGEFWQNLPRGWKLEKSFEAPAPQRSAIGRRLGAPLAKLTNTHLTARGTPLQINILHAEGRPHAAQLRDSLRRLVRNPIMLRDNLVIEFICSDARTIRQAKYELGFQPRRVSYRVQFTAAPLKTCDYMSWNKLFNLFLQLEADANNQQLRSEIAQLSQKFEFADALLLRNFGLGPESSAYSFVPSAAATVAERDLLRHRFHELPRMAAVPSVRVVAHVTSHTYGLTPTDRQAGEELLAATRRWPSTDLSIARLAAEITAGQQTVPQKAAAILAWMRKPQNMRYDGSLVGSRYGVPQVLQQRFGHCWDYSDFYITLCRASDVPCRQVAGWLYGQAGHVWAEVLFEGQGWRQVDPSAGMGCGSDYIPYLASEQGELPLVYLSLPQIEVLP